MNEYCDYLAKISRKISMKKLFMLLCIGLLFLTSSSCHPEILIEQECDFLMTLH